MEDSMIHHLTSFHANPTAWVSSLVVVKFSGCWQMNHTSER
jgi:hypothetical protein